MSEKELYQQKAQAQLDEWKAELEKLKAKASGASADAQLEMKEQIQALEGVVGAFVFCRQLPVRRAEHRANDELALLSGTPKRNRSIIQYLKGKSQKRGEILIQR